MKHYSILFTMVLLFSFFGLFGQNKKDTEINLEKPELKSGQVWKYNTRKGEEKSRVLILKVEQNDKGETVIHIAVSGLKIKNPQKEIGISEEIGHLIIQNTQTFCKYIQNKTDFFEMCILQSQSNIQTINIILYVHRNPYHHRVPG